MHTAVISDLPVFSSIVGVQEKMMHKGFKKRSVSILLYLSYRLKRDSFKGQRGFSFVSEKHNTRGFRLITFDTQNWNLGKRAIGNPKDGVTVATGPIL